MKLNIIGISFFLASIVNAQSSTPFCEPIVERNHDMDFTCPDLSEVCFEGDRPSYSMLPESLSLRTLDNSLLGPFAFKFCGTTAPSDTNYCLFQSPDGLEQVEIDLSGSDGLQVKGGFVQYRRPDKPSCIYRVVSE